MGRPLRARLPLLLPLLLLGLLGAFAGPARLAAATSSPTSDRVLVIYNASWPTDSTGLGINDSQQVADYYAHQRGIPAGHLLGVSCSTGSGSTYGTWSDFQAEVIAPIQGELTALGPDAIDVLLVCYGVPYQVYSATEGQNIAVDNCLMALNYWAADGSNVGWNTNPYLDPAPGFLPSPGHFDHASVQIAGGGPLYLVARLDGPRGAAGAMELVDQALYGDRYVSAQPGCYQGNVYVDSRYGTNVDYTDSILAGMTSVQSGDYSSYYSADNNMAWAEHYVPGTGLHPQVGEHRHQHPDRPGRRPL